MNEHDLDLDLDAIGAKRTQVAASSALRERVRGVPLRRIQGLRWLPPMVAWRTRSMIGATKLAVAVAILALVGGVVLVGQLTGPTAHPGAAPVEAGALSPAGSLASRMSAH